MARRVDFSGALAALLLMVAPLHAAAQNAGEAPTVTAELFRDPPPSVRPIYRWWLPLAAVEGDELRREIDQMVEAGAGGVEVAAMPVPGDIGRDPEFLREYGFGTKRWSTALETIFERASHHGMRVDLMVGALWPTTVPSVSSLDDPAAQQQLVAGYKRIAPGAGWSAPPPVPAAASTGEARRALIAILAVRCATADCPETGGTRMVDPDSLQDLTGRLDPGGKLNWTAPVGDTPWWVVAFYQTADGQLLDNLSATTPNYVVDHLGPAGARAVTDFYDRSILNPRLRSLIRGAQGSSLFEDSFEPSPGLKWTSAFLTEFARRRGYSLVPYLPMLVGGGAGGQKGFFDYAGIGERVREDYRQTFSDLYGDHHIKPYGRWAHANGMITRLQIEGGPMEIGDLAMLPDIAEGENRNFLNNPELWKIIGVGAQLRPAEALLSTECCPVQGGVWATTAGGKPFTVEQGTGAPYGQAGNDANLNWVYKAYAGGVNQLVWHGFPYRTTPPDSGHRSRWPGNSFDGNTQFSEAFGPAMPQWPDYRLINDHLARLQLVLRQGRPRYDIAVFWHDFGVNGLAPNVTAFTGYPGLSKMLETTSPLAQAGFTWQYVGPAHLAAAAARDIRKGVWQPERAGFKAILLNDQAVMPVESLRKIRDIARRGHVPLIIVGRAPSRTPGLMGQNGGDAELARLVSELRMLARKPGAKIRFVADEAQAREALATLGIAAAASHRSDPMSSDILSVRRHSDRGDYYLLFNQGTQPATQTLVLSGAGAPFEFDSWTGEISPLAVYERVGATVRLPVTIGPNDVKLIAIGQSVGGVTAPAIHAIATDGHSVRYDGKGLQLRLDRPGRYLTRLSNNHIVTSLVDAPMARIALNRWTLDIESWSADATGLPGIEHMLRTKLPEIEVSAGSDGSLPGWPALGHPDKAGVGIYMTEIELPTSWKKSDGGWLDLGRVVDTFRVTINGMLAPPTSFQDTSRIDIGPYLRAGSNRIEIRVATPLRNSVEASTREGAKLLTEIGLIGPVVFRSYRDVPLTTR